MEARITAAIEVPYLRHPSEGIDTEHLLADAFRRALTAADLERDEVDGLGVASFTLAPDHVADLAWRLGVQVRWLMEDTNGGASGLNMLQHARRALEAGDANTIVLLAGDRFDRNAFRRLVDTYNRATQDHLAGIPTGGPNAVFAHLTQRHMAEKCLERSDYGRVVVAQREWAARNPIAVYREPLTLEQYLAAPVVAAPLHRYDCAPVVSGADALVLRRGSRGIAIRALTGLHNVDNQEGDGLRTGLAEIASELWEEAGVGPDDMDAFFTYDDYPAMSLIQLEDIGAIPDGDVKRFLASPLPPINTSGGQLSAGQAGAAGGMHGLVEAVRQMLGLAGDRDASVQRAVVCGYGMVLYRYGACANAVVLEAA
ncbi:MAG TPA: thiolase family protein [Gaiellaceae bacterium]|nr:thiolase family protein [Gaiellaceae bacterium]